MCRGGARLVRHHATTSARPVPACGFTRQDRCLGYDMMYTFVLSVFCYQHVIKKCRFAAIINEFRELLSCLTNRYKISYRKIIITQQRLEKFTVCK